MSVGQIFSESNPVETRACVCEWAAENSSNLPHAVRYVTPPETDDNTVTAAWERYGPSLALTLTRFDEMIDELYEVATHDGPTTHVTAAERQYIVETALTRLQDPENPLFVEGEPTAGLVEQAAELLTLLEFAGLTTADAVETRLTDVGVAQLADPLAQLLRETYSVRDELFGAKTFRGERYLAVIERGEQFVSSVFSTTDVVVVGAVRTLSPLERDFIELLDSAFETAALIPRVPPTASPSTTDREPSGANRTLSRVLTWYSALGFESETDRADATGSQSGRTAAAGRLYRHQQSAGEAVSLEGNVHARSYPSRRDEITALVRSVRARLADGADPEAVCIALYDETYATRVADQLRAADVPVSYTRERAFSATWTGQLFDAALELGREPTRQAAFCALLSNPLVEIASPSERESIVQKSDRLEATQLDALHARLGSTEQPLLDTVVSACETFATATQPAQARNRLLDELAVPVGERGVELANETLGPPERNRIESQALERAAQVCETLTTASERHTVSTVRRALERITVQTRVGRRSDSVQLVTPMEAATNPHTHVFVPGLTTEHTPSPPRRLAFARKLNDADIEFAETDVVQQMRHSFALLLASDAELTLTRPEADANGEPHVPADVLSELIRLTTLSENATTVETHPPATRNDIHQSIAQAIETGGTTAESIRNELGSFDIEVPGANVTERLHRGLAVSRARGSVGTQATGAPDSADTLDRFRGRVSPDVVAQYDIGASFSPTALERYAACGFNYYMNSVLGFERDEEVTIEADALDIGGYVHAVLEAFYEAWAEPGEKQVTSESKSEAATLLYEVAVAQLDDLDATDTAFHRRQLSSLFDGLAVADNQMGDPDGPPGLFQRFLDAEAELAATPAHPVALEGHVGLGQDDSDVEVLSQDPVALPGTDATLHGKIDRVDATPDGELVTYDYKTGDTPSEDDTLDGYKFQLPTYLLMAESALDGDPVGGTYYRVNPDDSVSYHSGTIGASEDASYSQSEATEFLQRHRTLSFETREAFQEFLHDSIPDRVSQIETAVQAGSFSPTVLGPDDAGCSHCEYRAACDVRHHRRHESRERRLDDDRPVYIPEGERREGEQ